MFDRFTDRSRKAMGLARQAAQRLHHDVIDTEHILLGVLGDGGGVACETLRRLGVDLARLRAEVERITPRSDQTTAVVGQVPFTRAAKTALESSLREAKSLGHTYIGTEHLLLGLLSENQGVASRALKSLGVGVDDARAMVRELLRNEPTASSAVVRGESATSGPPVEGAALAADDTTYSVLLVGTNMAAANARLVSPHVDGAPTADAALLDPEAVNALRHAWALAIEHESNVVEEALLYGVLTEILRHRPLPGASVGVMKFIARAALDGAGGEPRIERAGVARTLGPRRFSPRTLAVIGSAFSRAAEREASRASAEDLLAALLEEDDGPACCALRDADVDPATLRPPS